MAALTNAGKAIVDLPEADAEDDDGGREIFGGGTSVIFIGLLVEEAGFSIEGALADTSRQKLPDGSEPPFWLPLVWRRAVSAVSEDITTQYGFRWGSAEVARVMKHQGSTWAKSVRWPPTGRCRGVRVPDRAFDPRVQERA
ncbi:hypothetical protein GS580_02870 [Rhodococcus hoagii]|nr:hypothetical protein [Prescottella equi]